jgi:acyl-[acyl carrier protein]--UDP-N-acetylglucosamine O-acyltransferase
MAKTHPTAIVEPGAVIHDSAEIGALMVIPASVRTMFFISSHLSARHHKIKNMRVSLHVLR